MRKYVARPWEFSKLHDENETVLYKEVNQQARRTGLVNY